MPGLYFVVTLGVQMQVLPHAKLQSHESGCVVLVRDVTEHLVLSLFKQTFS